MAIKKTIKVNSNPNPKPYKGMESPAKTAIRDWEQNDALRKAHYDLPENEMTHDVIKVHSSGVLGGAHMGGHSDVSAAVKLGGFTVKTPVIKPTSTKNK